MLLHNSDLEPVSRSDGGRNLYTSIMGQKFLQVAAAFKQASGLQQKMAASEPTYGRFRTDMPKIGSKNQNGVSNYRMAYQIIVASFQNGRTVEDMTT